MASRATAHWRLRRPLHLVPMFHLTRRIVIAKGASRDTIEGTIKIKVRETMDVGGTVQIR